MKATALLVSILLVSACGPLEDGRSQTNRRPNNPREAILDSGPSEEDSGLVEAAEGEGEGEGEVVVTEPGFELPPCDVVDGDVEIINSRELALYAGCRVINGRLRIIGKVASYEALSDLEEVHGELFLAKGIGTDLHLEKLRTVDGLLTITAMAELPELDLPALGPVESVRIIGNPKLPQCQVDALLVRLGLPVPGPKFTEEGVLIDDGSSGNDDAAVCE